MKTKKILAVALTTAVLVLATASVGFAGTPVLALLCKAKTVV